MKQEGLEDFNKWHNRQNVDIEINTPWHKFVVNKLTEIDLNGKKILEIGCGRGGFACWLARNYANIYDEFVAADFSSAAIEKGKTHAQKAGIIGINWNVLDITQIDLPSDYFDIVISCETIEHVPYPKKAVKELYRVIKKGGTLILTTPNYGNFYGLYRIYLRMTGRKWTEVGQPINQFVIFSKTKTWISSAGFKVIFSDSKNISYPSPFQKKDISLNWERPKWLIKRLGINSFFMGKKS